MASVSSTQTTCGSSTFPLDCPIIRPTDGAGGSCYTTPFTIPICPTFDYAAANLTSTSSLYPSADGIARPLLQQYTTFEILDQSFYRPQASDVAIFSIGLAVSVVTLCNVLVLTPSRKRGGWIHSAVLVGLVAEVVSCACGVWLGTQGALVSAYLVLTGDWGSNVFSISYRVAMTLRLVGGMVGMGAVQVAFAVQGRGLCCWVRVRWGLRWYHSLMGVLVGVGAVSFLSTVAFVVCQVRWVALVREGEYLPVVYTYTWFKRLSDCYRISAGVSLGLWSGCFAVTAGFIVWERRRLMFVSGGWSGIGGSEGPMARLMGNRGRVRNAYEGALRLIGVVAVESFIVPIVLCILSVVPKKILVSESLILPVVLALLPMSSLFLINESPMGPNQRFAAGRSGVADSYGSRGLIPEISSPPDGLPTDSIHVFAELHNTSTKPKELDSKGQQRGQIERELQAIDRM